MLDVHGMTPHEVVDLIGPPFDRMGLGDLLGGGTVTVGTAKAAQVAGGRARRSEWWEYKDLPKRGRTTYVEFRRGRVGEVRVERDKRRWFGRRTPSVEWARRVMREHLDRVDSVPLTARAGWHLLRDADTIEFAAGVDEYPNSGSQVPCRARRFVGGDGVKLDVLVTILPFTDTERIRGALTKRSGSYRALLADLVEDFAIRPNDSDVAHWVLGRDGDDTVAHLAYVPGEAEVTGLLPVDLMSDEAPNDLTASGCSSCDLPLADDSPPLVCPACGAVSEIYPKAIAVHTLREGEQARACTECEQVTLVVAPEMVCPDCKRLHADVNDRLRARYERLGPGDPADAPCVGCGYYTSRPDEPAFPLDILIDCQRCGNEIAVPEADFPQGQGMHLRCGCGAHTVVPKTIWCPNCGEHIRARGIAELVAEANARR